MPRKKLPADLRSFARGHTALCIRTLAGMVSQGLALALSSAITRAWLQIVGLVSFIEEAPCVVQRFERD